MHRDAMQVSWAVLGCSGSPVSASAQLPARNGSGGWGGETTIMGLEMGITEREPAATRGARGGSPGWAEGNEPRRNRVGFCRWEWGNRVSP